MVKKIEPKEESKLHVQGKESVKKGKVFEEQVASIYRLLGAEISLGIMIVNKKVDILATFPIPGARTSHRVLIECKNESRQANQNARVNEFISVLENARKLGLADSGAIITLVPWSEQAKGTALLAKIEICTYGDKLYQLLDFKSYLEGIVNLFENDNPKRSDDPAIGKYYVDPCAFKVISGEEISINNINHEINQWVNNDSLKNHLAILGEYGTGKSSLCLKVASDFAKNFLESPTSYRRIPILINLREFTKTINIESFVTSFLDSECGISNPKFKLFDEMNKAGAFLVILDGFDEMAIKVDQYTLELNLEEIEKLAYPDRSKVLLTCRTEYFMNKDEEIKSFSPDNLIFAGRKTRFDVIHLATWNNERIDFFLKKRVELMKTAKENWEYYKNRINTIPGLADLSNRPVLLEMIVKTLPILISSNIQINRPKLYETYLDLELRRQTISKKRKLLISDPIRFELIQKIALKFWISDSDTISFKDAESKVKRHVRSLTYGEIENYTRELLSSSFLIREENSFRFSHRSILEFLIAKELKVEVDVNKPISWGKKGFEYNVASFIKELHPDIVRLVEWVNASKAEPKNAIEIRAGNALEIIQLSDPLLLYSIDLKNVRIRGAAIRNIDFRDVDLTGAQFIGCFFFGSPITKLQYETAQFLRCYFNIEILCDFSVIEDPEIFESTVFNTQKSFYSMLNSNLFQGRLSRIESDDKVIVFKYLSQISSNDITVLAEELSENEYFLQLAFFREDYLYFPFFLDPNALSPFEYQLIKVNVSDFDDDDNI